MTLQSENINELMSALSKAQGEMSYAVKDSINPHYRTKYSDLAGIWSACREPLAKNGLAVVQALDFLGQDQVLVSTLGHSSGQWIKSIMKLPIQKPGPQEVVSCITYCRRASLAALVGVYQDDDDGEAATKAYRQDAKPLFVTGEQRRILDDYVKMFPDSLQWLNKTTGGSTTADVPQSMFESIVGVFKKRIEKKEEPK